MALELVELAFDEDWPSPSGEVPECIGPYRILDVLGGEGGKNEEPQQGPRVAAVCSHDAGSIGRPGPIRDRSKAGYAARVPSFCLALPMLPP